MSNPIAPDLAVPIRAAILNNVDLVAMLPLYLGSPTVFTRRPVDPKAPYPLILISGNVAKNDNDGIVDKRLIITRDIAVYGTNENSSHYRAVESMADIIYAMFDKVHNVLTFGMTGWNLCRINCTGPIVAPVDDDLHVGRIVSLQVMLANPASA